MTQVYYFNKKGEMHKLDGPANPGNGKYESHYWYIEGVEVSFPTEFLDCIRNIAEHGKAHEEAGRVINRPDTIENYSSMLLALRDNGYLTERNATQYIETYVEEYIDLLSVIRTEHIRDKEHELAEWFGDKKAKFTTWWDANKERLLGTKTLKEDTNGSATVSEFYYDRTGKVHRSDGPAFVGSAVRFNSTKMWHTLRQKVDATICSRVKVWCKNGERHRLDGPAIIGYSHDGSIRFEYWIVENVIHREDGPAYILYDWDGDMYCEWYWDGLQIGISSSPDMDAAPVMWKSARDKRRKT